jgi:glutathione synthase
MNILFIVDPLASFKIKKDTSFAMMREAQKRGHKVSACEVPHIQWQQGECVKAAVQDLHLTGDAQAWFEVTATRQAWLKDFDAIIMRKDPPFRQLSFSTPHTCSAKQNEKAPRSSTNPSCLAQPS